MKSIISVSNDDSNIIFQKDGWAKISPLIESYFNRINSFNNNDNFDKHAIPKNEFSYVYMGILYYYIILLIIYVFDIC